MIKSVEAMVAFDNLTTGGMKPENLSYLNIWLDRAKCKSTTALVEEAMSVQVGMIRELSRHLGISENVSGDIQANVKDYCQMVLGLGGEIWQEYESELLAHNPNLTLESMIRNAVIYDLYRLLPYHNLLSVLSRLKLNRGTDQIVLNYTLDGKNQVAFGVDVNYFASGDIDLRLKNKILSAIRYHGMTAPFIFVGDEEDYFDNWLKSGALNFLADEMIKRGLTKKYAAVMEQMAGILLTSKSADRDTFIYSSAENGHPLIYLPVGEIEPLAQLLHAFGNIPGLEHELTHCGQFLRYPIRLNLPLAEFQAIMNQYRAMSFYSKYRHSKITEGLEAFQNMFREPSFNILAGNFAEVNPGIIHYERSLIGDTQDIIFELDNDQLDALLQISSKQK